MSDFLVNITKNIINKAKRIEELEAENEKLKRERDLALAHDTQPYPTAYAYELVCKIKDKLQAANHILREGLVDIKRRHTPGAREDEWAMDAQEMSEHAGFVLTDAAEAMGGED